MEVELEYGRGSFIGGRKREEVEVELVYGRGSFIGGREREEEEVSVLEIGLGVGEKEGSMQ